LYVDNVQIIGGLCSQISIEEAFVEDYLRCHSEEISGLPEMFSGVNENFATAVIEGALTMAGDSVDHDVVRSTAVVSGVDILPARHDIHRAVWAVSKKRWRSFGYDYVLAVFEPIMKRYSLTWYSCFDSVILTLVLFSLGHVEGNQCDRGCACRDYSWCEP
jgi:hypothetical protein